MKKMTKITLSMTVKMRAVTNQKKDKNLKKGKRTKRTKRKKRKTTKKKSILLHT